MRSTGQEESQTARCDQGIRNAHKLHLTARSESSATEYQRVVAGRELNATEIRIDRIGLLRRDEYSAGHCHLLEVRMVGQGWVRVGSGDGHDGGEGSGAGGLACHPHADAVKAGWPGQREALAGEVVAVDCTESRASPGPGRRGLEHKRVVVDRPIVRHDTTHDESRTGGLQDADASVQVYRVRTVGLRCHRIAGRHDGDIGARGRGAISATAKTDAVPPRLQRDVNLTVDLPDHVAAGDTQQGGGQHGGFVHDRGGE